MKTIRQSIMIFTFLSLLVCGIYPAIIMGVSETFFKWETHGKMLSHKGQIVGSELIAQEFTDNKYFWARPSAAGYNASASSGSNYALINNDFQKIMSERKAKGLDFDLLTASASGLDPHISPKAAHLQIDRVAAARNLKSERLIKLISANTEQRQLGFLGEDRVNVLKLNLDLENLIHE